MKRIAICISGQMRNINKESPIFRLINNIDADIFVSTWSKHGSTSAYDRFFPSTYLANLFMNKNEDGKYIYDKSDFKSKYPSFYELFYSDSSVTELYLKQLFPTLKDHIIEELPQNFEENCTLGGVTYPNELLKWMPERYKYSLNMYYMIYQVDLIRRKYENINNFKYACVIRIRADIEINDVKEIIDLIENNRILDNTLYVPNSKQKETFLNDMFALGNSTVMSKYSNIFEELNDYWNLNKYKDLPYSKRAAESLLSYHILNKDIKVIHLKQNVFITTQHLGKDWKELYLLVNKDSNIQFMTPKEQRAYSIIHYYYYKEFIKKISLDEKKLLIKDLYLEQEIYKIPMLSWSIGSLYMDINDFNLASIELYKAYNLLKDYEPNISILLAKSLERTKKNDKAIEVLTCTSLNFQKEYFALRELGKLYLTKYISDDNKLYLQMAISYLEKANSLSNKKNKICLELLEKAYDLTSKSSFIMNKKGAK